MKLAAIDFSMTSPCLLIADYHNFSLETCTSYTAAANRNYKGKFRTIERPCRKLTRTERAMHWAEIFLTRCRKHHVSVIFLEAPAYRARNLSVDQVVATQIITDRLQEVGVPVIRFAPTTLKKVFCGSGKAPKTGMRRAFEALYPKHGFPYASSYEDFVDAYACAYCGVYALDKAMKTEAKAVKQFKEGLIDG